MLKLEASRYPPRSFIWRIGMENLCHSRPLQTRVVFYLIRVLLKALGLAESVDIIFGCVPVAGYAQPEFVIKSRQQSTLIIHRTVY